jgi:hypothetical protein
VLKEEAEHSGGQRQEASIHESTEQHPREMSEWLKEHAWKLKRATLTD